MEKKNCQSCMENFVIHEGKWQRQQKNSKVTILDDTRMQPIYFIQSKHILEVLKLKYLASKIDSKKI